jgi:hypothetical protein
MLNDFIVSGQHTKILLRKKNPLCISIEIMMCLFLEELHRNHTSGPHTKNSATIFCMGG